MGAREELLTAVFDKKRAAILRVLLNAAEELSLNEIAQRTKVPMSSAYRILQELAKSGIIERKEWKNSKVYRWKPSKETPLLQELFQEEFDGVAAFLESIKNIPGVQSIIQHGGKKRGRANLLLIGEGLNTAAIEEAARKVREKKFELSFLTLTKSQYEQMAKMGLYSGEKEVVL
ncbi:MAG TPA: helix-turn-helix domain-containing protein [Candidatus Nanoarchaeia archaeon]|nr:helix-turn-helix domain-containing protein [Candidatus Nanoarchaeia archaeon]